MLYLFINQLGWLTFIALLIVVVVLYAKINQQLRHLRRDMAQLQAELEQHKDSVVAIKPLHSADTYPTGNKNSESVSVVAPDITASAWPPNPNFLSSSSLQEAEEFTSTPSNLPIIDSLKNLHSNSKSQNPITTIEPDERWLPMVTSVISSVKNWFFGGNLVVRVGVLVLLVGVVLLLRLLSDYIEIPITVKLTAIGIIGLGLAGLGLKLAKNRFAYGITLQGAGLAIAYLSTFFAYSVYHVISSLPSFMALGILSALTVALAVRQNAFPLALLACISW